ncbi:MAG: ABC transporter ATP-binding protein [Clostridia bacterium]|nr:ABC transporter ATP-binding protein [Clostridia bacterium]
MSDILKVAGLCKKYPAFELDNVGFTIPYGKIMGFIGRNGAGKTTTLKSISGLVCPDAGSVEYFGMALADHENEIKQRIGFAAGAVNYYKKKKLSKLIKVYSSFYDNWDDNALKKYLDMFRLDLNKTPSELSEGMKVKLNLVLALSHNAELLILDEPTSGLDPVSRDELLEILIDLCRGGVSILFSTHIISDLEKCADMITYIKNGRIISSGDIADFANAYLLVKSGSLTEEQIGYTHGVSRSKNGDSHLIKREDRGRFEGCVISEPTLEEIMIHLEKEEA